MRNDLRQFTYPRGLPPSHFGLAYDAWAPVEPSGEYAGKVPAERGQDKSFRANWLSALENLSVDPDYREAYGLWSNSLQAAGAHWKETEITSRLLVGHGNSSATEVGLTVHHTWGVPIIPGSALKGLCAHYTAATYGAGQDKTPTELRGPTWAKDRRRIVAPPGEYYRALFGAPDVDNDASGGFVTFHDALYVPGTPTGSHANKPFAVDVLTVHQRSYYGQVEGVQRGQRWPNDYDSPNPVGFISVKPGTKFLLALSGEGDWACPALGLLSEAIDEWGIGGKTSAGYGHGRWSRREG
jgi:CRISPR-associated protein Cmr6